MPPLCFWKIAIYQQPLKLFDLKQVTESVEASVFLGNIKKNVPLSPMGVPRNMTVV